jgi:hypothetical protein
VKEREKDSAPTKETEIRRERERKEKKEESVGRHFF